MLGNLISSARSVLWEPAQTQPPKYSVGRLYVKCTDVVRPLEGEYTVGSVNSSLLKINGGDFHRWVNGNLLQDEVQKQLQKKKFHVQPFSLQDNQCVLHGPWNVFDTQFKATADKIVAGDVVRVRVAPIVINLAPNEFKIGLRAVDVIKVRNGN